MGADGGAVFFARAAKNRLTQIDNSVIITLLSKEEARMRRKDEVAVDRILACAKEEFMEKDGQSGFFRRIFL